MSKESIKQLLNRLLNEPALIEEMRADAGATARRLGIELTGDELQGLQSANWTLPDEEIQQRIKQRLARLG